MSDSLEIISVGSSPPSSPFFDLPITRNKVSEMCMDTDKSEEIPFIAKISTAIHEVHYHSLSDSEDEPLTNNSLHNNSGSNLSEIIYNDHILEAVITSSPSKLSQNNEKSKVNDRVLERKRLKELKAKERAEKVKEKAEKAAMLEKIRQSKPGQCMKYVTVILDENVFNSNIGKRAIELFKDVEFKFKVQTQGDPYSVTWTREEPGVTPIISEEKHILFVWSFDNLVTSVKYCTLIESFKELKIKYSGFRIYLAIYGLGEYYKKLARKSGEEETSDNNEGRAVRKRKRTVEVPREQIDVALAELEIILKVSTRLLKNHHELSILLQQITKAIAETPHRKETEKRDMEKCWYARGDSRDCVKIDKNFNGLHRLWLQQLSQFNKSSLDIARSIAECYPSPYSLYEAYLNVSTLKEKDLLLQNIQIKKGNTTSRRVGPELSRKVCLLFGQKVGDIHLSQE